MLKKTYCRYFKICYLIIAVKTTFTTCLLAGCFSSRFFPVADPLKCVALTGSSSEEWLDLWHVASSQQSQLIQPRLPTPLYQLDVKSTPPITTIAWQPKPTWMPQAKYLSPVATRPLANSSGRLGLTASRTKEIWKSRSNHTGDNVAAILPPPIILTRLPRLTQPTWLPWPTQPTGLLQPAAPTWLQTPEHKTDLLQTTQPTILLQPTQPTKLLPPIQLTLMTKPTELTQQPKQTQQTSMCLNNNSQTKQNCLDQRVRLDCLDTTTKCTTSINDQLDCWTRTTSQPLQLTSTYVIDATIQPIALPCLTQQAWLLNQPDCIDTHNRFDGLHQHNQLDLDL